MQTEKKPQNRKKLTRAQRRRRRRIRRNAWRITLSVLTVLVLVLIGALCAGYAAFKGPSQTVGDLLTVSMQETSALKFVPHIYYSNEEVDAILERNSVSAGDSETDTSLIVIEKPTPTPSPQELAAAQAAREAEKVEPTPSPTPTPENLLSSEDGIEVYSVVGGTYQGYMMVVKDPSRVTVGTCRDKFDGSKGLQLKDIAKRYDAVAAINGGGFEDRGGVGNGGIPVGLVISEGKVKHTGRDRNYNITVGFDKDNIMVLAKNMSDDDAKAKGIRDAITFGPALIVNGEPASVRGESSGLNPRTAIGQRKDGAVLMLVIDGRQASSLGATYSDLITIMLEYGAVNAINMDGGSSSLMYYKGEYLNSGVVLTGSRKMPTAFIVR
ncbi:MAG: phosphodiester glycosidase family protein [Clostridia bacterium]|nr:phosphodiester glycosidase family protein [Clostridia bacterium]MBQ9038409.1 phosphodiester glycosidase family protein [Clostridia bacterium]